MTLTTEETPICNLPECWALASLETGELYRLGLAGAALIWLRRGDAELAGERLAGRFVPVKVRVVD